MKKIIAISVLVIGIILFAVGIFLPTPGEKLSTYPFYRNSQYSTIEEYVGGDAYNYIIGASLVGGKIAGVLAMKGIFIGVGILIVCIGAIYFAHNYKKTDRTQKVFQPFNLNNSVPTSIPTANEQSTVSTESTLPITENPANTPVTSAK